MITDIPQPSDFRDAGLGFINLAADQIFPLFWHLRESGMHEGDGWDSERKDFWQSAQKPLAIALTLVYQGIEFLIKGRIASVSPFLLLSGGSRDWPAGSDRKDVAFAEFHTVDAQDLIRTYNTFSQDRLSSELNQKFGEIRKLRNSITHSIDLRMHLAAKDVLVIGIDAVHELVQPQGWIVSRRKYLENTPISAAWSSGHVESELITEVQSILDLFSRSELEKYFGFRKKQRPYICPICTYNYEGDLRPVTAQLRPNSPKSTSVHCFVCEETQEVTRDSCRNPGCKGNVIWVEDRECLTCFSTQPEE